MTIAGLNVLAVSLSSRIGRCEMESPASGAVVRQARRPAVVYDLDRGRCLRALYGVLHVPVK